MELQPKAMKVDLDLFTAALPLEGSGNKEVEMLHVAQGCSGPQCFAGPGESKEEAPLHGFGFLCHPPLSIRKERIQMTIMDGYSAIPVV